MTSSSRIPLVLGNWKMNTTLDDAAALAGSTNAAASEHPEVETGILPPAIWLVPLAMQLGNDSAVLLGTQDVAAEPPGAFTGDIAAEMLAPYTRFMLVGHSERRHLRGETDSVIRAKLDAVYRVDRIPVLAVGETEDQRRSGRAAAVVAAQLDAALRNRTRDELQRLVIAYEPVWA
ncbi:MAG TPA: triose-phosphate isomerase, partial [Thermomicrobiales bacterium]|nr:triose-phosphate isomerase [Thermomicrobiales bacterium]